jgi:hypothetical protein
MRAALSGLLKGAGIIAAIVGASRGDETLMVLGVWAVLGGEFVMPREPGSPPLRDLRTVDEGER